MKFLFNTIQISSCPSPSWACPCGVQDIPEPSHRLSYQYSMPHSPPPKDGGPNIACPRQGTLVVKDGMSGLSAFLPIPLCSKREDIPHACGCGPCSRHLSVCEHSPNRKSEPKGPDIETVYPPSIHYSDILSPILYGNSNYLSNGNSCGNQTFHKTKTFIETKVTAMKLQGFNL